MSTSVKTPLRQMHYERITAALTAAGVDAAVYVNPPASTPLPYVNIAETDENDSFYTADTTGNEITATIGVWAERLSVAEGIAEAIIEDLTSRSAPPTLPAPHHIVRVEVQSAPTVPQPSELDTEYLINIRLRYQIMQTA